MIYKQTIDSMSLTKLIKENRSLKRLREELIASWKPTKEIDIKIMLVKSRVENIFKPT